MNGIPDVSSYLTKTPVPPKILNTQLKHAQSRNKSKQLNEELTNSMKRLTGKCNKSLGNTEMILKSLVAKNKELGTLKDSLKHLPSKISSLNTLLSSVNIPENLDELLGELKTAIKFNSYGITYVQGSILESSDLKGGVTIDSKLRKKHLIDSISSKMSLQFTCAGSSSKISSKSAIEELVVVDCLYNPIINLNDDCILVIEYYNTGVPFTIDIITLLKIFGTNCALILNLKDVEYNKCLMKVNDKIERMYRKSVQQNETEKLKDLLLEGVTYLNGCIDLESVTLLGTLIDLCRAFVKTGDSVFCDDGKVWGEEGIKAFVEDGEKEFEDFDSFTYVIECKNLEGGVNGYVVFRRLKSVIVSESTVEHKFKDSELKAFKELSGIVGSSIERIQNLETEKRLLNDTSISSVKKLKAIEEKEIRRKAQQSYEGFKGQKDAQEIKGEVLRLKTRIITLEKFGKGQESRRIKGDRILEKVRSARLNCEYFVF